MGLRGSPHAPKFVEEVVRLRYEGKSAREVASRMGYEYKKATGRTMTRNVVIGLWNRHGNFSNMPRPKSSATHDEIMEEWAYRVKKGEQVRIRKCLCCGTKVVLDKAHRICGKCKSSVDFVHGFNDYPVRLV